MIDNALTLEGLFSIVLFGRVKKTWKMAWNMALIHKIMERTHVSLQWVCLRSPFIQQ